MMNHDKNNNNIYFILFKSVFVYILHKSVESLLSHEYHPESAPTRAPLDTKSLCLATRAVLYTAITEYI